MNSRIWLSLMAISTVALPLTGWVGIASAKPVAPSAKSCDAPIQEGDRAVTKRSAAHIRDAALAKGVASDPSSLDFSEAESDAAVALFGCDCPSCLRSLQQLRSQSLSESINGGQGHCWSNIQQRASDPEVRSILEALEAEEKTR